MGSTEAAALSRSLLAAVSPDASFIQPVFPPARGTAEIEQLFRKMFTQLPDMLATPRRSAIVEETVFIESACTATLGRKQIRFDVCDRFTILEGKVIERVSFSDPLPTLLAALRRPSSWPRLLRSRLA